MHPVSPEQRQQMLGMAVNAEVVRGASIREMDQTSAVLLKKDEVNHILHLLLTVFTCGLWAIIWLLAAASARVHMYRLVVDEFGIVRRSKVREQGAWVAEPHDGIWWRNRTDRE